MGKDKENPDIQSDQTATLAELASGLDTLSQRVKNTLGASNLEFPEDSQEGNTDRKYFRSLSEGKAGVDSVWDNVGKVDAKMLAVMETLAQMNKNSLNSYDELNNRKKAIVTDHVEAMAALHTGLIRNTEASMMPIIPGNQIASTREVAQDSVMADVVKANNEAFLIIAAKLEALERFQNDANKGSAGSS